MLKNQNQLSKRLATFVAMILLGAFAIAPNTNAQEFENNTGGVYKGSNGIIRMKGTKAASYTGTATNEQLNGVFTGTAQLGTSATNRIEGIVIWAKNETGVNQFAQTGLFFTKLGVMNDGSKTFGSSAYDGNGAGTTNVSETFLRYPIPGTSTSNILHPCGGEFIYDGTTQTVLNTGALGTGGKENVYATLTIASTTSTTTATIGAFTVETQALKVNTGGTFTIDNAISRLLIANTSPCTTVSDIVGSLFVDAAAVGIGTGTAALEVGNATRVEVHGTFQNNNTANNNTYFGLGATGVDASTIAYGEGATHIVQTLNTNPYGRLEIMSDYSTATHTVLDGNVYIGGTPASGTHQALYYNGNGNIYTGTIANDYDEYGIHFVGTQSIAEYGTTATGEVVGWVYRDAGAITTGTNYIFNNAATSATIAQNTQFGLKTIPGADLFAPVGSHDGHASWAPAIPAGADYGYINRLWEVDYEGAANSISTINLGYLAATEANSATAGQMKHPEKVRGFEAYENVVDMPLLSSTDLKAWNGPSTPAPTTPTTPINGFAVMNQTGSILLNNVASGGVAGEQAKDLGLHSQIVFGDVPAILISVINGRWSNPTTWNVGMTPQDIDSVIIRNIIYTGLWENPATGFFGVPSWSTNEYDLTGVSYNATDKHATLARSVVIENPTGAAWNPSNDRYPALVIGNHDAAAASDITHGMGVNELTTGNTAMDFSVELRFGQIINNNPITAVGLENAGSDNPFIYSDVTGTGIQLHGLHIMQALANGSTATTGTVSTDPVNGLTNGPIVNPLFFKNAGLFMNRSVFDVGRD